LKKKKGNSIERTLPVLHNFKTLYEL